MLFRALLGLLVALAVQGASAHSHDKGQQLRGVAAKDTDADAIKALTVGGLLWVCSVVWIRTRPQLSASYDQTFTTRRV